jgi:micrococcal nuclease
MRRFSILVGLLLLVTATIAIAEPDNLITARVLDVPDGDSILILTPDNKQVEIKLFGIDCPEENQPFGEDAKQYTSQQCMGKIILYRIVGIDIYERMIATVFLEDGRELNLELLKAGLAWHYNRYSNSQAYTEAESQARKAGIGLWADENPTPPWEWQQKKQD